MYQYFPPIILFPFIIYTSLLPAPLWLLLMYLIYVCVKVRSWFHCLEREGDTVSIEKKGGRSGMREGKNKQDQVITNSVVSIVLSNNPCVWTFSSAVAHLERLKKWVHRELWALFLLSWFFCYVCKTSVYIQVHIFEAKHLIHKIVTWLSRSLCNLDNAFQTTCSKGPFFEFPASRVWYFCKI